MPLLIIGAVLGVLSIIFLVAYLSIKNKKETLGFDRNIKDSVIIKRLLGYAKPYYKSFVIVLLLMAFCVVSDITLPLIVGSITEVLGEENFLYLDVIKRVIFYICLFSSLTAEVIYNWSILTACLYPTLGSCGNG